MNSLPDIRATLSRSPARLSPPRVSGEKCRMMIGGGARTPAGRAAGDRKVPQRALYGLCRPDYSANLAVLTRPYPGIGEMLETLRREGMRLTVVSNKDQGDAERVLARCFPGFPFDLVLGRQPSLSIKPDRAPGLKCLSLLGASPEDAVVVGDSAADAEFAADAVTCAARRRKRRKRSFHCGPRAAL